MLLAGSFDSIVCTEPVSFAADAVIYPWDLNGSRGSRRRAHGTAIKERVGAGQDTGLAAPGTAPELNYPPKPRWENGTEKAGRVRPLGLVCWRGESH